VAQFDAVVDALVAEHSQEVQAAVAREEARIQVGCFAAAAGTTD
jgi:hypothetical protein